MGRILVAAAAAPRPEGRHTVGDKGGKKDKSKAKKQKKDKQQKEERQKKDKREPKTTS